jgi:hypothetical protein
LLFHNTYIVASDMLSRAGKAVDITKEDNVRHAGTIC